MAVYLSKMAATMVGPRSKREILQSAILFILSTAITILTQTNILKFPFSQYIFL